MDEKLPIPCDACSASGLRHGAVCAECQGKGYRLSINGKQISARQPNQQFRQRPRPAQNRQYSR
jgi:hypothetical protein